MPKAPKEILTELAVELRMAMVRGQERLPDVQGEEAEILKKALAEVQELIERINGTLSEMD